MYKIEKLDNFRFLYTLLASKSSHPLRIEDVVSEEIHREIQLVGELADISYCSRIALERVFKRIELFSRKHFPLEGYEAVTSSNLILPFEGEVANVMGLVAYRPTTKQLVVSICGTRTGFMSMYTGLEALAFKDIRKGLEEEEVRELVLTGHSMGAALSYYLAVGLLTNDGMLPPGIRIKVVTFGSPRVEEYRFSHGQDSFQEYSVRAYNDGIPMLPPTHRPPLHPKGGHNYYNGRELEKLVRRVGVLSKLMKDEDDLWVESYVEEVARVEKYSLT
ncbi:alpha/beta-hydrolase [Thelephora ganbajun]|uniref:Alpha/beta-hydrolase n=1 Tax=Thelephora ganbajun TaxID=370292 RepID=A0ACB6ZR38_THEGA|nr:alpha/beta-hydrolase [Thelephora ganbajun]